MSRSYACAYMCTCVCVLINCHVWALIRETNSLAFQILTKLKTSFCLRTVSLALALPLCRSAALCCCFLVANSIKRKSRSDARAFRSFLHLHTPQAQLRIRYIHMCMSVSTECFCVFVALLTFCCHCAIL